MRTTITAIFALAPLALGLSGCKVDVDEKWSKLVPEEGIYKFIAIPKSDFNAEGATIFYAKKKVTQKDLVKAFEKRVGDAGYDLILECEEPITVVGAKDDETAIIVNVKDLTADHLSADLQRGEYRTVGFPEGKACKWTEAAKKHCVVSGDACDFDKKQDEKKAKK